MSFRSVVLATAVCAAPVAASAQQAQQAAEATPAGAPAPAAPAASTAAPLAPIPQPRPSPLFQARDTAETLGAPDRASGNSEGKNHTIVLSTLAIVLIGVIVLLLIL